ncbi:helix-turn-helix domain-containing protein [Undibacterium sp. TC4M20W]|uniref:helix-turn-helix domain-containing protein n=1 Tax=Undibacterium sp. TC4M20W TaxID=3413052 RepID=UPI003BF12C60
MPCGTKNRAWQVDPAAVFGIQLNQIIPPDPQAHHSGLHAMAEIAAFFGVHYVTVSRAVRAFEKKTDLSNELYWGCVLSLRVQTI